METTVVDGTAIVDTVFVVGADDGLVPARSVVMLALAERVADHGARPPQGRSPASDGGLWRAVINS